MKIHCVILESKNGPIVLHLSGEFQSSLEHEDKRISLVRKATNLDGGRIKVRSVSVLYGENGAGKTKILIDIANVFSNNKTNRSTSILFTDAGTLYLKNGTSLSSYKLEIGENFENAASVPGCPSIFYTTSPYEYSRRRSLAINESSTDVSPSFGQRNTFDGLALLSVRNWLNKSFLERCKIRLRMKLLSFEEAAVLFANEAKKLRVDRALPAYFRATLLRTARQLEPFEQSNLRCLLSVFFSTTPEDAVILPNEVLQHLSASNDAAEDSKFLASLRKLLLHSCHREIGRPKTHRVISLLELIEDKIPFKSLTPAQLERFIETELSNPGKTLYECSEVGLISFSISGLSSGETAFAVLFAALHGALRRLAAEPSKGEPIFVLIDEGEMFMHPRWQREYLKLILDFLERFPRLVERVHLILTTHSLIVAGDSPPNSLLDVETGRTINAFGLGPRSVLEIVYGVPVFQGELSENLLEGIERYLRKPADQDLQMVRQTISQLADLQVAQFLTEQVDSVRLKSQR